MSSDTAAGTIALKKKWGLGALAPWLRIGVGTSHVSHRDSYRDTWCYSAPLSVGKRIDERLSVSMDYVFERRRGRRQDQEVPALSSDAFSTRTHTLSLNVEYSLLDQLQVTLVALGRHGDVIATEQAAPGEVYAARALAEDPAFGAEGYAYRLMGATFGAKLGLSLAPTPHTLVSVGAGHYESRTEGADTYLKTIVELSWRYQY